MKSIEYWKFNPSANTTTTEEIAETIKKEWTNPKSTKWTIPFAFGIDNVTHQGTFRINGWAYDLKPFLNKYVVRTYEGALYAYYAPNKTALRTAGIVRSKEKLLQIPKTF